MPGGKRTLTIGMGKWFRGSLYEVALIRKGFQVYDLSFVQQKGIACDLFLLNHRDLRDPATLQFISLRPEIKLFISDLVEELPPVHLYSCPETVTPEELLKKITLLFPGLLLCPVPRIYILEDNPDFLNYLRDLLETTTYETRFFSEIPEFAKAVAGQLPDLVILDCSPFSSPGEIRALVPHGVSILLCSSLPEPELIRWAQVCKAQAALPRLLLPRELLRWLEQFFTHRLSSLPDSG